MDKIDIEKIVKEVTEKVLEKLKNTSSSQILCENGVCSECGQCVVKNLTTVNNIVDIGASRISVKPGLNAPVDREIAKLIDHTLLRPDASRQELIKLCDEAKQYGFASVCVNSSNIPLVVSRLKGSSVKAVAVVGFPLGASSAQAKAFEAKEAVDAGAAEIDMVMNIGALKSRDYAIVLDDIERVVKAVHPHKVKVIIETSMLEYEEKIIACALAKAAGASFVKTSTGFSKGGATVEDIILMRKIVGAEMEVKASGGIKTIEDAKAMIKAGANRIGASASVQIVMGKTKNGTGTY